MQVVTIVGARPQFIKLAPFSRELRGRGHRETILHTGQHYDEGMSARFFMELDIPEPDVNLHIGSGSHGTMTARALEGIEAQLLARRPDVAVVFGDTNSTLAGALAAAKLCLPCVHVEAGLRSFDRSMPEELNRVIADHCCDLLFAPTTSAATNLSNEGLAARTTAVGDIMVDALLSAAGRAPGAEEVLARLGVGAGPYALITLHRAANTDNRDRLGRILAGFQDGPPAVFPVHPRTRAALTRFELTVPANVTLTEPLGYLDTIALIRGASVVATDSGGLQKESYLLETPCVTLRENTEWTETVDAGWNLVVGDEPERIRAALARPPRAASRPALFGDGHAAARMLDAIEARYDER